MQTRPFTTKRLNDCLPPVTSKRKSIAILAVAALVIVAAAFAIAMMLREKPADAQRAAPAAVITVSLKPAELGSMPTALEVSGSINARDPLTVGAQASGLAVTQILAEEGDYVKRGEVLARLDSSVLQAQLKQAQARLSGSEAAATKAVQPNRPQDIAALQAAYSQSLAEVENRRALLAQAQASQSNAEHVAQRSTAVYQQGGISMQEAEQKITDAHTAAASVRAIQQQLSSAQFAANQAEQRLKEAQAGGRQEDIVSARASAAENAAQVEQLRAQIEQTIVRAPDDGLITKRDAHLGDIATAGKTMFEMVRGGVLELRAQVTQRDLAALKPGFVATISDGTRTASGTVTEITPAVDPMTRLGTARIQLAHGSGFLPGMFAHATLQTGTQTAVMVPQRAVQGDANNYFVFVYDNGVARKTPVSIGARTRQMAEIASGVSAGDNVIVDGAGFLSDGDHVKVSQ